MPIHDWSLVRPGTFHDFHASWITHLKEALNEGLLPEGYYALSEQPTRAVGAEDELPAPFSRPRGITALADELPRVSITVAADASLIAARRRRLVIRHGTGDRIISILEILSPGNKASRLELTCFLDKAVSALRQGYHLLIVDLHRPGPHDPSGIHGSLWSEVDDGSTYSQPRDKPLTLASYSAGVVPTAYVEPVAVGQVLPDMPLFLDPEFYVNVPLERTYMEAWRGVPERWRRVIEGRAEG